VLSSKVVNRTATFAFYLGDRFFGVISAHVPGPEAANFDFTSALAAELLKILAPSLEPMIERSGAALSPFPAKPDIKGSKTASIAPPEHPNAATGLISSPTSLAAPRSSRRAMVLAPPE
jgi:hypothetical protein